MSIEYRKLGNSGTIVTKFCLGTMTFGAEADEATSHRLLDDYAKAGGNFIDTADVYSTGVAETIVGKWLKGHPTEARQMVVASKARFPMGPGPNDIGISRRHLSEALDASLRRLGLQQLDLYQMHAWDALTPIEETLRFLDDAIGAGKIAYYGFSNFLGWHVAEASALAKARGWAAPMTLQPQYSLLAREIEFEIVPACLDAGIGLERRGQVAVEYRLRNCKPLVAQETQRGVVEARLVQRALEVFEYVRYGPMRLQE